MKFSLGNNPELLNKLTTSVTHFMWVYRGRQLFCFLGKMDSNV